MAKRNRLTNSSDETDIATLVSGDVVFSIPYFQRSYKWKQERLIQLNQDLLNIVDQASDSHFLGAIIIHGRSSNPSDPKVYDVIDGQQRITTLFLYISAVVKTLADQEEFSDAASLFLKYLAIPRDTSLNSNLKLHPCKEDRAQLNIVIKDILKSRGLRDKLGSFNPKMLPSSGSEKGVLLNNYKSALRFLYSQFDQGGLARLKDVYEKLLESMSVVQIDVWDPTNGPKIFDSLNSRQEPMTIGDLVRNEIFSRVANEHPDEIEQIDQQYWQPFYKKFQEDGHNLFDSYFFPYGLVQNANLKKSEVYNTLREEWRATQDPKTIIERLSKYQDAFIDIACGKNSQNHPANVASLFNNLHRCGGPSSTYPFLMQLSRAIQDDCILQTAAVESLQIIESFLIRRAVCGHEPTGLHAVFKRLWIDCEGKPDAIRVRAEITKHKTVVWPTDDDFKKSIKTRPLYGAGITKYLLQEYDSGLGGDQPEVIPWIEHVLPENPSKDWLKDFSKEQHEQMKDRLSNLIPLSKEMNASVSNKAYSDKRDRYKNDSMFKSARIFADEYEAWNPDTLNERSEKLSDWAIKRWPL